MENQYWPKLYKIDTLGNNRIWAAEALMDGYRTISGIDGGLMVKSEWTKCKPKNVGRANATTAEEQVIVELKAMYTKKRKEGYREYGEADAYVLKPMLAKKFEDYELPWDECHIYSQPKLDGIRCLATSSGLQTRKAEPIVSCPHVFEEIADLALRMYEDIEVVFDGELYNHRLRDNFNEITSLVRKQTCTGEHLQKTATVVQYHIYDAFFPSRPDLNFSDRLVELRRLGRMLTKNSSICIVDTLRLENPDLLDISFADYIERGYEGQMVRIDAPYEFKRSAKLLKRKDFIDEEFEIVAFYEGEGNRSNMAGGVTVRLPDGRTNDAGISGGVERNRVLWEDRDFYVGQMATIRFQGYTPDGKLRFPVLKDIGRDDA